MMLPPRTCSPPKRFTPSRWEFESRPLRELPPPFLCAIDYSCFALGAGFFVAGLAVFAFAGLLAATLAGLSVSAGVGWSVSAAAPLGRFSAAAPLGGFSAAAGLAVSAAAGLAVSA